jgi:hypothetical protein
MRAGNILATLDTVNKAIDVMVKNVAFVSGTNTQTHKRQEARANTIKNIVNEMRAELTPTLKTYVRTQAKLLKPQAKRTTTYAKVTEKVVTV